MSLFVCFSALNNLFSGQDAIGETEYFISVLNVKNHVFSFVFLFLVFIVVKFVFRFKNERVRYGYIIATEVLQNDKPIRNFCQVVCVNGVAELSTCYFISKSFETGYEIGFKEVVGFLVVPIVTRIGVTVAVMPTQFQWMMCINNAFIKVENDKKTRNIRSIILLIANKYDIESKNKIKDLPVELIQILSEFLE